MILQSQKLASLPGIRHVFFTREGGVSTGLYGSLNAGLGSSDDPANIVENRARMAGMLGVEPGHFLSTYQIHSPDIVVADKPWSADERPRADGLVTKVPGLALGVGAADCGPVLFADAQARVIGAAHAGWKGALAGVIEATVAAMEGLGARREHMTAAIGPLIHQPNYEVGPEFVAQFRDTDPSYARFFSPSPREGHAMFDLPGFLAARLQAAGVGAIEDLGLCTYADEARFFSYRRATHRNEPDYGRHVHGIALVN